MIREALRQPSFSGESTDAQRGRQTRAGGNEGGRHKEARSWQKVGLDQTGELAGERKDHQENQVPAGVDSVYPLSLSHTFFMCQLGMVLPCLLPRVAHKKHVLRVKML